MSQLGNTIHLFALHLTRIYRPSKASRHATILRMPTSSLHPLVLAITRVFVGLTLLGRSYVTLAFPTGAPMEYIETPAASLLQLHAYLIDATQELANHSSHVYFNFKNQRYGAEADISPRFFHIDGLPKVEHLEASSNRLVLSEEDLLRTHHANLGIYYQAMQFLIDDEAMYIGADDFLHKEDGGSTFYHVLRNIERTQRRITEIMAREGYHGENQTPVEGTLSFTTENAEHLRNLRDVIVLYEIYKYTNAVLIADVRTHATAHKHQEGFFLSER